MLEILTSGKRSALAIVLSAGVLAGCVAASGYNQSPTTASPSAAAAARQSFDDKNLLVVIRFPALYDRSKDNQFENVYQNYMISLDPRPPRTARYPTPFKNALIKTNYYVMELYEALRARLPQHTVALQPQRWTIRNYTLIPEVGFEMPPAVVYVDFMTYVYSHKFITSDSNTFGQFISPFITVRTAANAAPATSGALVGTDGLEPKSGTRTGRGAANGLGYTWINYINDDGGKGQAANFKVISKGPIKPGQYLEVPQVNIDMGAEGVMRAASVAGGLSPASAPSANVMRSLSGIVLDALSAVDADAAVRDDMQDYIQRYDRRLASRYASGRTRGPDRAKLDLIQEFIAMEREFLREQDKNLFAESYRGGFGDSVRKLLAAESKHHADFWGTEIMASLAILGTGLASGAATGNYMPSSLWDIYFQSQQTTSALNTAFEKHFAGVRSGQIEFTVKLSTKVRKIRVSNIDELRAECRAIYAEEFGVTG